MNHVKCEYQTSKILLIYNRCITLLFDITPKIEDMSNRVLTYLECDFIMDQHRQILLAESQLFNCE